MNTIEREVQYLGTTDCFLYRRGSYVASNYFVKKMLSRQLPTVAAKYEQLLIDNNIAYNKLEGDECEIYDQKCYECEDVTLPVYVYHAIKGVYIHTGKEHTEYVVSNDTLEAARSVKRTVDYLMLEADVKEAAEKVKALLDNNAIAFIPTSSPLIPEFEKFRFELLEKNRYFISPRLARAGYGRYLGYVIVDLKEAEGKSVLDLDVPEHLVGLIIGVGARNIKNLINNINELKPVHIKRINVHKIAS